MLKITVEATELFDEQLSQFIKTEAVTIELEYSLVALSKWEEIYEVPFMRDEKHTPEELLDFIRCMTLTPGVPDDVYMRLTNKNVQDIYTYMKRPMTATTIFQAAPKKTNAPSKPEKITAELIYYWMTAASIPFECQHWHLNKLMTLIKVASVKNNPDSQKMSKAERAQWMREENARRMQQNQTSG